MDAEKMKILKVTFLIIGMLVTQGCVTTKVYDHILPPTNLTRETDKIYFSGAYGTNGFSVTTGGTILPPLQAAAAFLTNRIKGDTKLIESVTILDKYKNSYFSEVYEFMLGTYFPLEQNAVLEIFVGTGKGRGEDFSFSSEMWNFKSKIILRSSKGDYRKLFAQLNIGARTKSFVYGMAFRANKINFSHYEQTHSERGMEFKGEPEANIWEATIFGRLGGEVFKAGFSATYAYSYETLKFQYNSFTGALTFYITL